MKAYVLHDINDLRYEDVPMPKCPPGWAIVEVKAAGICSSDIPRIFTKGTYHFPTIPGHEFAGKVFSVSNESDREWVGRHVGVFPLIPCRECSQCIKKHYEMCSHYDYIGSRRDGGFAEYVAVPIWNLIHLPDSISFTTAAMLEPLSVALHAIDQCSLKKGDRMAIIGTGMIGISAAQWASMFSGTPATVIGRNESKRGIIEKNGLNYKICNPKEEIGEFDVVLEAVGTPESIEMAIQATAPGGTVLLMGNPSDNIPLTQNVYWRILRKQLTLKGSWNSFYDGRNISDWTCAINALAQKSIIVEPLVSHLFDKEELKIGLRLMYEHQETYCKVMTIW